MRLWLGASLLALAATQTAPALAQEDATTVEGLVVTASRSGATVEELPTSVSVVQEQVLEEQLAVNPNIMRALEFTVPGLAPQQEGRSNCSPNIRGRATSVQINGVPVNEELRESTCDQVHQLSPFAVERVEVLRGGTALFGAGSPGGIINFVTRRARGEAVEIDAVAQTSFNSSDADDTFRTDLYAGAGQAFSGWDYYLGAGFSDGQGARTPDGGFVPARAFDAWSLNGAAGLVLAGGELRFTGLYYREEKGQQWAADGGQSVGGRLAIVSPVADHPQGRQNLLESGVLIATYRHPQVLGHELSVSGFVQDQDYRQRDNFWDATFGDFFFASDSEHGRVGVRSTLVKRAKLGAADLVASYGVDITRNRYYRPTIDPATGGAITGFIAPETILNTRALFAQLELDFGRLRLVGGARQEWYRGKVGNEGFDPGLPNVATPGDFGESDLALFNLGAVYDLTDMLQLYGGFSQGAELSELGRAARGIQDPSLITPEPATSDQYELGLRGRTGRLAFEAAVFRSTSDKAALLQPDPRCAGQPICPLIPLRAPQRFWGIDASAQFAATDRLDLRAVLTWQRGELFEESLGRYIDYSTDTVAPLRITGGAEFRPIEPLRLTLQGTYYGEVDFFSPSEQALGRVNTDAVFLLDASARYALGPGEVYVSAANLLDEEYVNVANQGLGDFFYHRAEGRRVTLGYRARF